jgi:hypothetical protein
MEPERMAETVRGCDRISSGGLAMPIHDWTRVDAGIFHDFHFEWISRIKAALNDRLPPDYYALAEQVAGGLIPDVLPLQTVTNGRHPESEPSGTVTVMTRPPQVRFRIQSEPDVYAAKARAVVIRHTSDHRVVAIVEIVSPGNKNSKHGLRSFVSKSVELLRAGVHLLILDLFPPRSRDPQGIHKAIWDEFADNEFTLPPDQPLTLAAYRADRWPEAFVEPTAVGLALAEMPVFLEVEHYVPLPLEPTYLAAWEAVPRFWRNVLDAR